MTEYFDYSDLGNDKVEDDFDVRTWKVIVTVPDGFRVGALFTKRDIVAMQRDIPSLEGTVFQNINTGTRKVLRNTDCNMAKIVSTAKKELKDTKWDFLLINIQPGRDSLEGVMRRIRLGKLATDPEFSATETFRLLSLFFGVD